MNIKVHVIYEKLTDLELEILETMEKELLNLAEQIEHYKVDPEERELICLEYEVTNELYFSILENFVKHGKAVEEAS